MTWFKYAPSRLTVLSALLLVLSFPPWNLAPLAWVALIPWLFTLSRAKSTAEALREGFWLNFLMSLGAFYWVGYVLHEYGELPYWVSAIGLLLFACICQWQFCVFAVLHFKIQPRLRQLSPIGILHGILLLSFLYAGLDWALPKLFRDTLGHSLYASSYLRQAADLGGAFLLTWMIFLVNSVIFHGILFWTSREEPSLLPALRKLGPSLLLAALLFTAQLNYGIWKNTQIRQLETQATESVVAGVVQANIGDFDKLASERGISGAAEKVIETFLTLSDRTLSKEPRPQFLIWPETAYPSTFRKPRNATENSRDQRIESYANQRKIPILFGGYDRDESKDFNTLFMISPRTAPQGGRGAGVDPQSDLQIYHKSILLLFGEYIPFYYDIPFIRQTFPQVANFGRGLGATTYPIQLSPGPGLAKQVRVSPIICYEALFSQYVIDGARKGSQLILNITNDSWFGPFAEPELHLALTVFRSLETRLPQLRSTNTGISALILPNGDITQPTPVSEALGQSMRVPLLQPIPTLMKTLGDWFGWFAWSMVGLLTVSRKTRV